MLERGVTSRYCEMTDGVISCQESVRFQEFVS